MHSRLTVASVAAGGFLIRFLRLGAIENDHYVYLARAHQILHGDWPVRDFVDPGFPLGYLLSTAAAAVAGPTLLTEAILSVALFAAALTIMFVLIRRASGSTAIGLIAVALLLLFPPRLYNSSKMLVPIAAIAVAWAYCDRPTRTRAAGLGIWTAIAFLFRHDYALLIGAAALPTLVGRHWGDWRTLIDRTIVYGLCAMLFVAPWVIYVQLQQGFADYLASAMRFSLAERNRTVSHWAPVYYAMAVVPVLALLSAVRGRRLLSPVQIVFAALLVLISDLVLLRDAPGSRLPDVYGITAVTAAIALGAVLPARQRSQPRTTAIFSIAVIVAGIVAGLLIARTSGVRTISSITGRWSQVTARLREARPQIMPDPQRAPLVDYIRRCTAADARILVGGFGPELPVLAGRAFAGGLPDWIRGYYEHPADVARARAQLTREQVALAVMLDGGAAFTASWPALATDLRARGLSPHTMTLASGPVELWVRESPRVDGVTGLPCGNLADRH